VPVEETGVQLQIAKKNEERQSELLKISGLASRTMISAPECGNLKADIETTRIALSKMKYARRMKGRRLRNVSWGLYISHGHITVLRQASNLNLNSRT